MPRPAVPALMKVGQLVQYLAVGDTDSMTSSAYFFCLPFSKIVAPSTILRVLHNVTVQLDAFLNDS
jgi:hypothetical protein